MNQQVLSIEDGEDTIKILLTTDNHVGYKENDPIRSDDSWKTFNEILMTAKDRDVDMIVHGGDLFDVNKPSKKSFYRVMESIRSHCLGDRPCELELLSDFNAVSGDFFPVNYEDPNINVSIPIFAISGNHDDATGSSLLLPMDVLAVSGLVNNFGKVTLANALYISPILLQKGTTKFALYGMSHVRDERLFRLFREGNVRFLRPDVYTDDWFNFLCVHQNHHAYSSQKSYLPELVLPDFLDFVYWGHEHECLPEPQLNPVKNFHTLLPGSSIVTSLSDGEANRKHVFILKIKGKQFSVEAIPLKSARPFILHNVSLAEEGFDPSPSFTSEVSNFLCQTIEDLVEKAIDSYVEANTNDSMDEEEIDHFRKEVPMPLIRLKVDVSGGFEVENLQRLSRRFVGKVANVDDIITIHQRAPAQAKVKSTVAPVADVKFNKSSNLTINSLITDFIKDATLNLLPEQGINNAIKEFVDKDDKNAINEYVKREIKRETKMLLESDVLGGKYIDEDVDPKAAFKILLSKIKVEQKQKLMEQLASEDNDIDIPPPRNSISHTPSRASTPSLTVQRPKRKISTQSTSTPEVVLSDDDSEDEYHPASDEEMIVSDVEEPEAVVSDEEPPKKPTRGTRRTKEPTVAKEPKRPSTRAGRKTKTTKDTGTSGGLLGALQNMGRK